MKVQNFKTLGKDRAIHRAGVEATVGHETHWDFIFYQLMVGGLIDSFLSWCKSETCFQKNHHAEQTRLPEQEQEGHSGKDPDDTTAAPPDVL